MTIREIINKNYKKESELLIANYFNQERIWVHLNMDMTIDNDDVVSLQQQFELLEKHYPFEYITRKVSFYSKEFEICDGVLIPRPETEILVDLALTIINKHQIKKIAEIGSGSGVISLCLAIKEPTISIISGDINPKATALSKKNQLKHCVKNVQFVTSDLFDNLGDDIELLVSNPPYIKNNFTLPHNVLYEPTNALFGGDIGDELIKKIIDGCLMRKIRFLCCEMGYDQKQSIANYVSNLSHIEINFYQDLAGFDRGFWIQFY